MANISYAKSIPHSIVDTEPGNDTSSAWDYFLLMKPRVMSLVVFTAFCGMWIAPGTIHPVIALSAILFITLGAGSAASINMWYDRDIDKIMERTKKRPIVTGKIDPDEALSFGVVTGVASVLLMALCVNIVSSILLGLSILYYVFIYTIWLKRRSIQNVVIGGASGALPPMIGWSCATSDISLESLSLFAIIFAWTPPHSWALALFRSDDYKNCNIPMMPVVKGDAYTKRQIIFYSILMIATTLMPYSLNMAGTAYLVISLLLGCIFLYYAVILLKSEDKIHAKNLFLYSILYLLIIFMSLMI